MSMNRAQRRAMKRNADTAAAVLAASCFDFRGSVVTRISRPLAVAALTRAFALLIRGDGKAVAIRLTPEEAQALTLRRGDLVPGGVAWLAVGIDVAGHASYVLQDALCDDPTLSSAAARARAMSRLAESCAVPGIPAHDTWGQA